MLALVAGGALAQGEDHAYTPDLARDASASDVIGMTVYAAKTRGAAPSATQSDVAANYDEVGTVDDLLLSRTGQVKAMVIGVGGFLGIGEKEIAVETGAVRFMPQGQDSNDFVLVLNADRAQLEALPAYDASAMIRPAETADAAGSPAALPSDVGAPQRASLRQPMVRDEEWTASDLGDMPTNDLIGASVYDTADNDVGSVDDLLLRGDGRETDEIVLDIGGFLGIGEHRVALRPDEVQIMRKDSDLAQLRVYVDATESELKALPRYDG